MLAAIDLQDFRIDPSFDAYIVRVTDPKMARLLLATGKPVVDVYGAFDFPAIHQVDADHSRIGRLAALHFLDRRFRSFAFCGCDGAPFSDRRLDAYRASLAERGFGCLQYNTPPETQRLIFGQRKEKLVQWLDKASLSDWVRSLPKPVAVFCSHDLRAYQLSQVCHEEGFSVPGEVAILGVDNDSLVCAFSASDLSSIDPDSFEIGRRAAILLEGILDGGVKGRRVERVPPKGLVVRASTETFPVEPRWLSEALLFISRNVARGLTASDVYAAVALSHTTVDKAFRHELGTSVKQTILNVRLQEARRLLTTTDRSVVDIARASGFSRDDYFCNVFKKAVGVTPGDYRQKMS